MTLAPDGVGPATAARPKRLHPAMSGRLALWAAVLVNLVLIEILFWTGPAAKNQILEVGRFLGLHLAFVVALQLVLVARLPWLDHRIGMDRLTSWHRWTGFTVFWLVILHPTVIIIGFNALGRDSVLYTAGSLFIQPPVAAGLLAAIVILTVGAVSVRAARRRLSYERWHAIHIGLYAVIALATFHQVVEGASFAYSPLAGAYWWAMWAFAIVVFVACRIVSPLLRNRRHQLRVAAVVPEAGNAVSVYITGRELHELAARPGQFMVWRFPDLNPWWQANPFSLSAAPDGQQLRLTAKAVGTTSAGLSELRPGMRVFAEGPYGAFTALHRTRPATLLIAGGVGITPIRALLEELDGPVTVLCRARTAAEATLLAEMQELAARRRARFHLLTGRTADGDPLAAQNLLDLVPDVTDRDVYVCGPPAMTTAVVAT
ncbi:MAG: ferredoxin reductase family protein, partial [Actinomycetes bacterium]